MKYVALARIAQLVEPTAPKFDTSTNGRSTGGRATGEVSTSGLSTGDTGEVGVVRSSGSGWQRQRIIRSVSTWMLLALVAVAISPVVSVLPLLLAVSASVRIKRKSKQNYHNMAAKELASVVDLYSASLRSGHNVLHASRHVTEWSDGPIAHSICDALKRADSGTSFSEALAISASDTAPTTNELFGALLSHLRYGTPILGDLERLSAHARDIRRKNAEARARKLPIVLLFPLVVCVLPAYLLVTVAPVLIEAMRTIQT